MGADAKTIISEPVVLETIEQVEALHAVSESYLGDSHVLVGHLAVMLALPKMGGASHLPMELTFGDAIVARAVMHAHEMDAEDFGLLG